MTQTRLQRLAELEARMEGLGEGLRLLAEQWSADAAKDGGLPPNAPRRAAWAALLGVVAFIDSEPGWQHRRLSAPLSRLLVALNEIEQGQTVEWLAPAREANPGLSPTFALLRGRVVSLLEMLHRRGGIKKKGDAALYVMDRLGIDACAQLAGRQKFEIDTLLEWCRRRWGDAQDSPAWNGFHAQQQLNRERLTGQAQAEVRRFVDTCLAAIADALKSERM